MPTTDLTDDQISDRVADEVAARILASHPNASGRFLRMLVTLYTAQATGRELPPGQITVARLAVYLDESPQRISEVHATAINRAWKACHEMFPELL